MTHTRLSRCVGNVRVSFVTLAVVSFAFAAVVRGAEPAPPPPCGGAMPKAADLKIVESFKGADGTLYASTTDLVSGEPVILQVDGLRLYQCGYRELQRNGKAVADEDPARLRLYLNGLELPTLTPLLPKNNESHVAFNLAELQRERDRHTQSLDIWRRLLARGLRDDPIQVSVGFLGKGPLSSALTGQLRAFPKPWFFAWLVFAVGLFVCLVIAARRSNVLRVPGPLPEKAQGETEAKRKAYSLARTQMAAWFFIVLVAYVLIWMITGALDTITGTVLGLMGISAATGFAATIVDTNGVPPTRPASPTGGFFSDMVSEGDEATLPRLQICIWTVVLILIFAREVYNTLLMPEFNATMLGLMGISGGTYIGFKQPDKPPAGK